jgi:hypothetical protein
MASDLLEFPRAIAADGPIRADHGGHPGRPRLASEGSLALGSRIVVKLPKRSNKGTYDDQATLNGRTFVVERY